jgi:hypothetical protein
MEKQVDGKPGDTVGLYNLNSVYPLRLKAPGFNPFCL